MCWNDLDTYLEIIDEKDWRFDDEYRLKVFDKIKYLGTLCLKSNTYLVLNNT